MRNNLVITVICALGLIFLNSCTDTRSQMKIKKEYTDFQKNAQKQSSQYKYFVKVMSPTSGAGYMSGSAISYSDALKSAIQGCKNNGIYDCIIHTRGNTVVYRPPSREDKKITYAKNVCRKVGYTPGTNDFRDCTIKIISAGSGQQTVIVGSGNRQQLLRPYPLGCRSMGGMANC